MKKKKVKILYSSKEIQKMIVSLAKRINTEFPEKSSSSKSLVVISVLKGAFLFTADLIRNIKRQIQLEFVRISSYGTRQSSSGRIEAPLLSLPDLSNRDVLIVEDIVDSGRTISFLKDYIQEQFKPSKLKVASLLNKKSRREIDVKADYIGFEVDNLFLFGYGLDAAEKFRHLPYLAYFD